MMEAKSAVDAIREFREEVEAGHSKHLAVQANHLCICGIRDVGVLVVSLGAGILLARVATLELAGWKRYLSLIAGAGLLLTAKVVPSHRMRFVTRASVVLGASAMILSTAHYTLHLTLDEQKRMEA